MGLKLYYFSYLHVCHLQLKSDQNGIETDLP